MKLYLRSSCDTSLTLSLLKPFLHSESNRKLLMVMLLLLLPLGAGSIRATFSADWHVACTMGEQAKSVQDCLKKREKVSGLWKGRSLLDGSLLHVHGWQSSERKRWRSSVQDSEQGYVCSVSSHSLHHLRDRQIHDALHDALHEVAADRKSVV